MEGSRHILVHRNSQYWICQETIGCISLLPNNSDPYPNETNVSSFIDSSLNHIDGHTKDESTNGETSNDSNGHTDSSHMSVGVMIHSRGGSSTYTRTD